MIPRIDVRMCNARGSYEGELDFEFEGDESLISVPYVTFSAPVAAHLHFEIFEDDCVDVTGKVTFSLKGLCSRCLSETQQTFEAEVDATFTPTRSDGEEYEYRNGIVNLEELLRDTLLIAFPSRLECDECAEQIDQNE